MEHSIVDRNRVVTAARLVNRELVDHITIFADAFQHNLLAFNGFLFVSLHRSVLDVLLNLNLMRLLELCRNQNIELRHDETATAHIHRYLLIVSANHDISRQGIILVGLCFQRDALSVEGLFFLGLYPTVFRLHHPNLALDQMRTTIFEVVQGVCVLGIQFQRHLIYIKGIVILFLGEEAVAHVENRVRLQLGIGRKFKHLLKLSVGRVVRLLGKKRITNVELCLRVVRPDFQGFPVILDGLLVVAAFVVAVASADGLFIALRRSGKHGTQQSNDY